MQAALAEMMNESDGAIRLMRHLSPLVQDDLHGIGTALRTVAAVEAVGEGINDEQDDVAFLDALDDAGDGSSDQPPAAIACRDDERRVAGRTRACRQLSQNITQTSWTAARNVLASLS
jgi:hypothetical protein